MNVILYFFTAAFAVTFALYEDQVGKFEWRQQYIGNILFSHVDIASPTKKLIVSTGKNVLAALSLKSGDLVWRQLFEDGSDGTIKAMSVDTDIVTISGSSNLKVRSWDLEFGHLVAEWSLESQTSGFWVFGDDTLALIEPGTRDTKITWFRSRTGDRLKTEQRVVDNVRHDLCTVVKKKYLACYSLGRLSVVEVNGPGDVRVMFKNLADVSERAVLDVVEGAFPAVTLTGDGQRTVVSLKPEIAVIPVKPSANTLLASASAGDANFIIEFNKSDQVVTIETYNVEGEKRLDLRSSFSWSADSGVPAWVHTVCQARRDGTVACRLVLGCADHTLAVVQHPGSVIWKREEALASVVTAEIVELPLSDDDAAMDNEFKGHLWQLGQRLTSQWQQLCSLLLTVLGVQGSESGGSQGLRRDDFGLHKIIVAVTEPGKIFGIDNLSGEIVWSLVTNIQPLVAADRPVFPLHVLRSAIHPPLPAQAVVVGRSSLVVFDPITGVLAEPVRRLPYNVRQVTPLHVTDENHLRPLLLLGDGSEVHVHPATSARIAAKAAENTFLYTIDTATAWMTGYRLVPQGNEGLQAVLAWQLFLGQDDAKIVAVAPKRDTERVHSQGRVLGDRSVLYKYVNPNLVAVVTQGYHPSHKSVVNVYMIDVVSGFVVSTSSQRRAREPVHVVHAENWLVYSWVSEKNRRTEIATLEMYEGPLQTNSTAFSSFTAPPLLPLVERQAYILPANVRALWDTVTEKGITSKHILVALSNGWILELPWAYVDPRRTIIVTQEMREEGVVPYMPELPIPTEAIINHNLSIAAVRNLVAAPSGLESTSLVFIYGLDLFYTRMSPSKTFDLLKEDFDYFLISAVLTALAVSSLVTRRLASRKALKLAWK